MADPKNIEITPDELKKSFITYRKDILQMPILALEEVTKYMQLRQGVRYAEEVGELAGAFEIGPFSYTRIDDEQVKIVGRKLETFLGSGVKEFNPIYLKSYVWESLREKELVNVFAAVGNFTLHPDHDEVEEGRYWNMSEIESGLGRGLFTPNFEQEFRSIKNTLLALL